MATKRLERTVIEGGRTHWCSWHRRHSHRVRRAAQRAELRHIVERHDDIVLTRRAKVHKSFFDKLGPCRRWLASHVGRRWDDVHALIMATFDTRSLPGRHIVFDHLLQDVAVHADDRDRRWRRFFVDENGVLRASEHVPFRRVREVTTIPANVLRWCALRRIGRRGRLLYWFVPVTMVTHHHEIGACRQHRRLTEKETATFEALAPSLQRLLLYVDT